MGINMNVCSVVYNSSENRAIIRAKEAATPADKGMLVVEHRHRKELTKRWESIAGLSASHRKDFATALDVIKRHNFNYDIDPSVKMTNFAALETSSYEIRDDNPANPFTTVTFYRRGSDNKADAVTVTMLDGSGKLFKVQIVAENQVSTFVGQALNYLKDEERTPPQLQAIVAAEQPRKPVLPQMQACSTCMQ